MADTLTVSLAPQAAALLRQAAAEAGESVEALAGRLLEEAVGELQAPDSLLSEAQLADLGERVKKPGPIATDKEVETFFSRFRD